MRIEYDEKRVKVISATGMDHTVLSKRNDEPLFLVHSVRLVVTFRKGVSAIVETNVGYKKYRAGKIRANAASEHSSMMDYYVAEIVDEMVAEANDREIRDAVEHWRKREWQQPPRCG